MNIEENKAVIRRYFEAMSTGNLEALDAMVDGSHVDHSSAPGSTQGLEGVKQFLRMLRAAFPDAHWDVEDLIAERDRVAVRVTFRATHRGEFLGIPATGKQVTMPAIAIVRLINGRLVESWINRDRLGLIQQLTVR